MVGRRIPSSSASPLFPFSSTYEHGCRQGTSLSRSSSHTRHPHRPSPPCTARPGGLEEENGHRAVPAANDFSSEGMGAVELMGRSSGDDTTGLGSGRLQES